MRTLSQLFNNNRRWAEQMERQQPGFFAGLARQQAPQYLWIGCSDSRVPANEIVGLMPGELFVHRNVANLVAHHDPNCMSVIQYAIDTLKVRHIMVCGHYGCGGVDAALEDRDDSLVARWLAPLRAMARTYEPSLTNLATRDAKLRCCCELNVVEQVRNVATSPVVRDAWRNGAALSVHGWIYDVGDGLLRDLGLCIIQPDETDAVCNAVAREIISPMTQDRPQ